ncbi:MAG: tetratricopeptide repeat protein [Sphingomonadaceae bacterium]
MAPIIRICSAAFCTLLIASAGFAKPAPPSPLAYYVAGRAAEAQGDPQAAASAYAALLLATPGDVKVAQRAYQQALTAGDQKLALRAAQILAKNEGSPPEARLLLYVEAIKHNDWRGARQIVDAIEAQNSFDFIVPTLRAWITFAARDGDPLALLVTRQANSLSATYSREHRALLLLAVKNIPDGIAAVKVLGTPDDRGRSLRLAAAAQLAGLKRKQEALALLVGDDAETNAAKSAIAAGRPLSGAVNRIEAASSILFGRIAADLQRERESPIVLKLARIASFAGPWREETKIILAQALSTNGRRAEALTLLDSLPAASPLRAAASGLRTSILLDARDYPAALALAKTLSESENARDIDYVRLGDVYVQMERFGDAASTYDRAIKFLDTGGGTGASWQLWLRLGSALDQAKDWPRAEVALQKALALAPNQPSILNQLGYSMIERSENLPEAIRLITKASSLLPNDPQITDSLGWALFKNGQTDEAITILERAVIGEPGEAVIGEHLGDAYWTAGRTVDARYAWRAALVQAESGDAERIAAKVANGLPVAR